MNPASDCSPRPKRRVNEFVVGEVGAMKSFGLINMGILPLLLEAMTPAYAQHDQREQESRRPNQEQEAKPERQQPAPTPGKQQPSQPGPERPQPPPTHGRQQPPQSRPERQPPQPKPAGHEGPRRPQEPTYNGRPQSASPARPEEGQRTRGQQQQQQQQAPRAQQEQKQRQQNPKGQQDPKQIQEQQRQQQAHRPAQQVQREYENQHKGAWLDHRAHNWQAEHRGWDQRGGYKGYRIPNARYRSSFGPSHSFRMYSFQLMVVSGFPRFQYGGLWFSVMDPWPEYWSDNWYGNDDLYVEFYMGGYYLRNRMHPLDRMALTVTVS